MARITTLQVKQGTLGLISLTRWKEQLPLASLTLLGGLVAFSVNDVYLDWRLLVVALANFLTVTFAFMINDIEDADDDAKDPHSAKRNPVTNGSLDVRTAWAACVLVVSMALSLYAIGGVWVLLIGTFNLILSFLYSWRPVRLKSSSYGLDVVSHTLMLGGLLPLAGYFIYSDSLHPAILFIALAATLGSMYGQLYNQIRDFDVDSSAGIVNVTTRLGKRATWFIAYSGIVGVILSGLIAVSYIEYPSWLAGVVVVSTFGGFGFVYLSGNKVDASGKNALDITGQLQLGFWFALSISVTFWIVWAMGFI